MKLKLEGLDGKIKAVAAGLGAVQALAWTVMSLICIILYATSSTKPLREPKTYMEFVNFKLYELYLRKETPEEVNNIEYNPYESTAFMRQRTVMTSGVFTFFMWDYLFLSIAWLSVSIYMLVTDNPKIYELWGYLTLTVCLLDFITVAILVRDYDQCLFSTEKKYSREETCNTTVVPVFLIAAKGFTLWIVNILFGLYVVKMNRQKAREEANQNQQQVNT